MTTIVPYPQKPLLCSAGGIPYNREHIDYWKEQARTAEAEVARLRKTLKPFAEVASEWDGEDGSLEVGLKAYDDRPEPGLSVATFREARDVLRHS